MLTADVVAAQLHCSKGTVLNAARTGKLAGTKPFRNWLFEEADVEAFKAEHRNGAPTAQVETRRRRRRAA